MLFCLFAEDTNILSRGQFSLAIESHTQKDGSDLASYLNRLFDVLNTPDTDRKQLPEYLNNFPYVNGGLFSANIPSPTFNTKSRRALIECGNDLDWSDINPDIFGSMIQAVVHPSQRSNMGMHYTSITNIMKVIEPLFLNDLYEALDKAQNSPKNLLKLQERIGKIKIFDPACGSGNFLIIAYKELRKVEMEVLRAFQDLETKKTGGQITKPFSVIKLTQFYGIELDHFAHEVAILSLWLTEHQMNVEFKAEFGEALPSLPLKSGGNIHCGNSARIQWEDVCSPKGCETYVLGNPPYLGSRRQDTDQKNDLKSVFQTQYKSIDYISLWFKKGADYIRERNAKTAFVSTNSICQGEQVSLLWPNVLRNGIQIDFAYESFKWQNSAKNNAAVIVIIVGLRNTSKDGCILFSDSYSKQVNNITPYLTEGSIHYIQTEKKNISSLPEMNFGNMPADGGKLLLTPEERKELIRIEPDSKKWIKPLISAKEFLNGKKRYCLWLEGFNQSTSSSTPQINKRIDAVRKIRSVSSRPKLASTPHLFAQITQPSNKDFILIPRHSSENREYIPIGFFKKKQRSS